MTTKQDNDIKAMTLEEAVACSMDREEYPEQFTPELGLDFKLETKPEYYAKPAETPRRIQIEITSLRGISAGAMHYYARILADGVNICYDGVNSFGKQTTFIVSGFVCKEFSELPREQRAKYASRYEITAMRELTQEEIDEDELRWEGYEAGQHTNAFYTPEDAEAQARRIIAARFVGDCKVEVIDDYYDV